ncbi:MAG: Mov34/MPN/PAD-1 family protein [Methyloprofundus sp.]|nr:Mov34/MPN/PAD-1 family protein [Methyloprofundus sp.]
MSDLVFTTPDGLVVFPVHLLLRMESYKQSTSQLPESGGVFFGSMRGKHIEITDISLPQPDDSQSRYRFARKSIHHFKQAVTFWEQSSGAVSYIGEWHTHPENIARPSSVDLTEWKKKLPKRPVFLVIIGINNNWYGYWNGCSIIQPVLKV